MPRMCVRRVWSDPPSGMPLYGLETAENGREARKSWFWSSGPRPPYLEPLEGLGADRAGPGQHHHHRLSTPGERVQNVCRSQTTPRIAPQPEEQTERHVSTACGAVCGCVWRCAQLGKG